MANEKRFITWLTSKPGRAMILSLAVLALIAAVLAFGPLRETPLPDIPPAPPPAVTAPQTAPAIDVSAARAMMEDGLDFILLDVRTEEEYLNGHIPGAILVPHTEIANWAQDVGRDARILLYCRSGTRSAEAGTVLVALGFTQVYDFGGFDDWPYETVYG